MLSGKVTRIVYQNPSGRSTLEGHGVGPLAPVATNASEPGKAKNRRVELVAR